jgi:5-methylcytosine-specific restriction endonuclease McrA
VHAISPASLDSRNLARRLRELAGDERNVQVDFLIHLAEYDRREAFLDAGYPSLWAYCLSALHLREGAAGRRIAAMRVLRRLPRLEAPLREGRLCLSTAALLGPLLTEENLDDLVARAAFKTKAEVDHLVATLQPRAAPKDGVRKLPGPSLARSGAAEVAKPAAHGAKGSTASISLDESPSLAPAAQVRSALPMPAPAPVAARAPVELRAVSENQWSLRVTIDRGLKEDLETLKNLLGHEIPNGDLAEVLREAIRCGIEKHGKRRGAVRPERTRRTPPPNPSDDPRAIPAELRRQVFERDGGRCTWVGDDERRCGSRFQLEIDHVTPPRFGGKATLDDLRILCKAHNRRHAEQVYGRKHMAKFRRDTRTGESTIAGDSDRSCPSP